MCKTNHSSWGIVNFFVDFCAREKLHLITTKKYELRTFDVLEIELVESFKREKNQAYNWQCNSDKRKKIVSVIIRVKYTWNEKFKKQKKKLNFLISYIMYELKTQVHFPPSVLHYIMLSILARLKLSKIAKSIAIKNIIIIDFR